MKRHFYARIGTRTERILDGNPGFRTNPSSSGDYSAHSPSRHSSAVSPRSPSRRRSPDAIEHGTESPPEALIVIRKCSEAEHTLNVHRVYSAGTVPLQLSTVRSVCENRHRKSRRSVDSWNSPKRSGDRRPRNRGASSGRWSPFLPALQFPHSACSSARPKREPTVGSGLSRPSVRNRQGIPGCYRSINTCGASYRIQKDLSALHLWRPSHGSLKPSSFQLPTCRNTGRNRPNHSAYPYKLLPITR